MMMIIIIIRGHEPRCLSTVFKGVRAQFADLVWSSTVSCLWPCSTHSCAELGRDRKRV